MTGLAVELKNLTRAYGAVKALDGLSLHLQPGEMVALLGPSGCGKTTALRILAGLDEPTSGTVEVGGKDITRVPANKRDMGMVFQAYSLFPHLTVVDNIAFGLKLRGKDKRQRISRAHDMLDLVGLSEHAEKYASQLSGGQQQRVAIARAIVTKPQVLFADEPTGNLDTATSVEIMKLLTGLNEQRGITIAMVTHEPDIAGWTRRIVRFRDGHIESDQAHEPVREL